VNTLQAPPDKERKILCVSMSENLGTENQGMFLYFNFPLRLIGASSLSGCYAFPFL
jgi:hypothetical protein